MRRFGRIVKEGWRLTRPYFVSEEKWSALALLGIVLALSFAGVRVLVIFNTWNREFFNAIQKKDADTFWQLLLLWHRDASGLLPGFVIIVAVYVVMALVRTYLSQLLQIRWRRWMTQRYVNAWLSGKAYYRIGLATEHGTDSTDNPDQRIAEDVRDFVDNTLNLGRSFIATMVEMVSFLAILWSLSGSVTLLGVLIPGYMVWVALVYSGLGTWLTHLVGRKLIGINFRQQRFEADFRYAAVRVRENAEGIALYDGESDERANLMQRFRSVYSNWRQFMTRTVMLNGLTLTYGQVAGIFPLVVVAPRYFSGAIELGGMMQVVDAFGRVQGAMSWFIDAYSGNTPTQNSLARLRSIIERLATFDRAIELAQGHGGISRSPEPADAVYAQAAPAGATRAHSTHGLTLLLPDGTELYEGLDLTLRRGESVAIAGRSGTGKSTLFRALAGLWPYGSGRIDMPAERTLFLPQRPYIPLGNLRHVVTYPDAADAHDTASIEAALAAVGLPELSPLLDVEEHWPTRLSGGEQQRIAFARAILNRPDWLFMDEATSSLDPESEAELYHALRTHLPGCTLVSISHRPEVAALHERRLLLRREAGGHVRVFESLPEAAQ
jgi:putative ATP-binding cassette transporter